MPCFTPVRPAPAGHTLHLYASCTRAASARSWASQQQARLLLSQLTAQQQITGVGPEHKEQWRLGFVPSQHAHAVVKAVMRGARVELAADADQATAACVRGV